MDKSKDKDYIQRIELQEYIKLHGPDLDNRYVKVYRGKKSVRAKIELSGPGREGLFGVDRLSPEQKKMYDEIQAEGNETYPRLVYENYPNKEKCMMKFGTTKRKSVKSKKLKRKCACKKN